MVRIGIIGVGGITNGRHIPEIQKATGGCISAICDVNEKALKTFGDKLGIPEHLRFTDYKDLIASDEVDAVEICTPNHLHVPMAVDVVKAGKPVNVEKPLSVNLEKAEPLKKALSENPVPNMMCFTYRFMPAVRYAKEIMKKGLLGDIISVNVEYLKSSAFIEGRRLEWRFVKEYAGTGVLGDLGVHLIDMAEFLIGDMKKVSAKTGIVVKERKKLDSEEYAPVETDDYCNFLAEFENGAAGVFTVTRCALGHGNTIKYDIYGTEGVISFNLNNPDILNVCIGDIDRECESMHTVSVPAKYRITQEQMFINMVDGKDCPYLPTVKDGLRSQKILDSLLKSSEDNCWIEL